MTATATDAEGDTSEFSRANLVGNQPPVAVASAAPQQGTAPLAVAFSSDGSVDPDGSIVAHRWDFGDGSVSAAADPTHTYEAPGTHTAVLTVVDDDGSAGTDTVTVTVDADPSKQPVAVASAAPQQGTAPLAVAFSSDGSVDPDGSIVAHRWEFGDGSVSGAADPTHTYQAPGTYTAMLTVADDDGLTGTDTVTVTVDADPSTIVMVGDIELKATQRRGVITVSGQTTIVAGDGTNVGGATVGITWTEPEGSHRIGAATTKGNGTARFEIQGGAGTYKLTVTSVYKAGHTFDAAASQLEASITP